MSKMSVHYVVAETAGVLIAPFVVLRVDTEKRRGDGVEAVVHSLHYARDVAESEATRMNQAERSASRR